MSSDDDARIQRLDQLIDANTEEPSKGRSFTAKQSGHVLVIRLLRSRILDEATLFGLSDELLGAVESHPMTHVVIDMSTIEFMSSAANGKFLTLYKRLKRDGRVLAFACIRPEIMEVFVITRLVKLYDIFATVDEAIGVLNERPVFG